VAPGQAQQQVGGLAVRRQGGIGEFGQKPDAGGEELRQGNDGGAGRGGLVDQAFRGARLASS
jgi:hypothetical protein